MHVTGFIVAWFVRAFAVLVRIREGLVQLKLARYTTLTRDSDLQSSHVLLRVQLLVYALSAAIHQNYPRAWTL